KVENLFRASLPAMHPPCLLCGPVIDGLMSQTLVREMPTPYLRDRHSLNLTLCLRIPIPWATPAMVITRMKTPTSSYQGKHSPSWPRPYRAYPTLPTNLLHHQPPLSGQES